MKFLCIGDLHITLSNIDFITRLTTNILEAAACEKPDAIILLGDVVDTFDIAAINHAVKMIKEISKIAEIYILVGNHDYINCHQFLTDNHWMNCLKGLSRIHVIDTVQFEDNKLALFCPFVEEGRFLEALYTVSNWRDARVIFAHQGFAGVPMIHGVYCTEDRWNKHLPLIVSGHIHVHQYIEEIGVWYPGSVEESKKSYFLTITVSKDDPPITRVIEAGRIGARTFEGSISQVLEENLHNTEITVRDTKEAIEEFKSSEIYTKLCASNSFKFVSYTLPFIDLYRKNIIDTGDVYTFCAAEGVLTGEEFCESDHLLIELKK